MLNCLKIEICCKAKKQFHTGKLRYRLRPDFNFRTIYFVLSYTGIQLWL